LKKYLPHDGKYKDVTYDIQYEVVPVRPPLSSELLANKLDIGQMADFRHSWRHGVPGGKRRRSNLLHCDAVGGVTGRGNASLFRRTRRSSR
jgi:NitT/TauT family transport system substrate-binding protein